MRPRHFHRLVKAARVAHPSQAGSSGSIVRFEAFGRTRRPGFLRVARDPFPDPLQAGCGSFSGAYRSTSWLSDGCRDSREAFPMRQAPTKKIARVIEATRATLCFELLAAAFALPPVIRPGIAIGASESRSTLCWRSVALLWSLIRPAETIAVADEPTIEVAPGATPISPEETPA
jgi:hypothetical protein